MPMYDRKCGTCDTYQIDCWEPMTAPEVPCKVCGAQTARVLLPHVVNVIGDDIPGGLDIRHGICHEDGTPKRYYTKSDIRAAAKAKGLRICDDLPDYVPKNRTYFS